MDHDAGVQLVDMNTDDIEILQILASGASTMIHRYTSYDNNGYAFYTRDKTTRKPTKTVVFEQMPRTLMATGKPTMGS
jgi:hypothetical protein